MWTPDPTWQRLSVTGDASRVWRRELPGRGTWVGKRLVRPHLDDVAESDLTADDRASLDPTHAAWWRREADVVEHRWAEGLPGVRGPAAGMVEEDEDGVVLWWPLVERPPADDLTVAGALGALAAGDVPEAAWACRDLLGDRWRGVERSGGWTTVARTPAAPVAEELWSRRRALLGGLQALPQVPAHGDLTPGNVLGAAAPHGAGGAADDPVPRVVACDWSAAGTGPVGADLGFFTLSTRSRLEPLAHAYARAAEAAGARPDLDEVLLAARVVMAFTVVTRLDRTLQRVAVGEGDWPTKLRHPAVAPAVRALQRVYPDVVPLLG